MNLPTLQDKLTSLSSTELIQFLQENSTEIASFFIFLTDEQLDRDKYNLQNLCYDFIDTTHFQQNRNAPEYVALLTLFVQVFEKINFNGVISYIQPHLPPNSVISHRLKAISHYKNMGSIKNYVEIFDIVMQSLQQASKYADGDEIVEDIIDYYVSGCQDLMGEKLLSFKSLFNTSTSRQKYEILTHPIITEYVHHEITEKLFVEFIEKKIYLPSPIVENIFRQQILDKINANQYLDQYEKGVIRANILKYGRANFTEPYQDISCDDKVELYCFFNMRKHFFTSYAIYEKIYASFLENIKAEKNFTFIDLGCGSLTSGLAIASLYQEKERQSLSLNYIGIDIAESMLKKAKEFTQNELFSSDSTFKFYTNWNLISDEIIEQIVSNNPFVIFNASYLFASTSLDENSLAKFVNKITQRMNSVYFIFQNPDRADRNQKYQNFKKSIRIEQEIDKAQTQKIYYKTQSRSKYKPSSEFVNYEILKL